ncbi:MAG: hypothetical protein ACT4P4_11740 [Betaproteobacteria bacterium]
MVIVLALFFGLPLLGIALSPLLEPYARVARIEAEIRALELERADAAATSTPIDLDLLLHEAAKLVDEAEALLRRLAVERLAAIDTRLARLRRDLAAVRR